MSSIITRFWLPRPRFAILRFWLTTCGMRNINDGLKECVQFENNNHVFFQKRRENSITRIFCMSKTHAFSASHWTTLQKKNKPCDIHRTVLVASVPVAALNCWNLLASPVCRPPSHRVFLLFPPSHFLISRSPPAMPSTSAFTAADALPWPASLVSASPYGDPLLSLDLIRLVPSHSSVPFVIYSASDLAASIEYY